MKAIGLAAFAALVAVARMAAADSPGAPPPDAGEAARASAEARAIVRTMETNTERVMDAYRTARASRDRDALRCANDALSRADMALRRGREESAHTTAAWSSGDVRAARFALGQLRQRAAASHEAVGRSLQCTMTEVRVVGPSLSVVVAIDPEIVRFEPGWTEK